MLLIAYTPYNVFMCLSLAARQQARSCDLVLMEDFPDSHLLVQTLRRWNDCPFRSIVVLPGVRNDHPMVRRVSRVARNVRSIQRLVTANRYRTVVVCNERRAESQAAIVKAKQISEDAVGVVLEDGLNAYRTEPFSVFEPTWAVLLKKLIYGAWFEDVSFAGGFSSVNQFVGWFPDAFSRRTRSPWIRHEKIRLPEARPFVLEESLNWRSLAVNYADMFGIGTDELATYRSILFLPPIENQSVCSHWQRIVEELNDRYRSTNCKLAIKYHPRDCHDDPLSIAGNTAFVQVSPRLTAEFLYLHPACQISQVIGGYSSSLLTAKIFLPEADVSCFNTVRSPDAGTLMGRLGIHLVDSVDQLLDPSQSTPVVRAVPNRVTMLGAA